MGKKEQKNKIKLFPHQKEGLRRVLNEPFYPLFMEQGTGKTLVAIKGIEERYKRGECNRVIIFCPNSITKNWIMELEKFLEIPKSDYSIERLNHRKKDKRLQAFNDFIKQDLELCSLSELKARGYKGAKKDIIKRDKKLLILVLNFEKSRTMFKELKKFKPHYLVVDESHKLKNRNAVQAKSIYRLTRACKFRNILTGTPICNGAEDIFMQYKVLDEDILGGNYTTDFENQYVVKGGYMGYATVGYKNLDKLRKIIADTSYRVRADECLELPEFKPVNMYCELNDASQKVYNQMKQDMVATIESSDLTRKELKAVCRQYGIPYKPKESYTSLLLKASDFINTSSCEMIMTQMMRLQQITGGFLTLDSGEIKYLGSSKLPLIKELVSEAQQPVIIFCQYIAEIDMYLKELSGMSRGKKKLRVRSLRDKKHRDKIYEEFQSGNIDVLILQMSSGSVGLNLQKSNLLIFASWNFSSDDYVQAIARIKRAGQVNKMKVVHLIAEGTIDEDILKTIKYKRKLAKELLD